MVAEVSVAGLEMITRLFVFAFMFLGLCYGAPPLARPVVCYRRFRVKNSAPVMASAIIMKAAIIAVASILLPSWQSILLTSLHH